MMKIHCPCYTSHLLHLLLIHFCLGVLADTSLNATQLEENIPIDQDLIATTSVSRFGNFFCNDRNCVGTQFTLILLPTLYGIILSYFFWKYLGEQYIRNLNECVEAQILERHECQPGKGHEKGIAPRLKVSFNYKNEAYTIWKNCADIDIFGETCHIYVHPIDPTKCVMEGEFKDYVFFAFLTFFSISTVIAAFFINAKITEGRLRAIFWSIYGCFFIAPLLITFILHEVIRKP